MAKIVAEGVRSVPGAEARLFELDHIDMDYLSESRAVIFGTPTYYANTCWQLKKWFDESHACRLEGKLGAAFATANYAQGGADVALTALIQHMMVKGMLVYSGGSSLGQPFIHLGAVALKENFDASKEMFQIFGARVAGKAKELFDRPI